MQEISDGHVEVSAQSATAWSAYGGLHKRVLAARSADSGLRLNARRSFRRNATRLLRVPDSWTAYGSTPILYLDPMVPRLPPRGAASSTFATTAERARVPTTIQRNDEDVFLDSDNNSAAGRFSFRVNGCRDYDGRKPR